MLKERMRKEARRLAAEVAQELRQQIADDLDDFGYTDTSTEVDFENDCARFMFHEPLVNDSYGSYYDGLIIVEELMTEEFNAGPSTIYDDGTWDWDFTIESPLSAVLKEVPQILRHQERRCPACAEAVVECRVCEGDGVVKGKVWLEFKRGERVVCPTCGGVGLDDEGDPCPECDEVGWVRP